MAGKEIVFAKLGSHGYMAGIDLDTIVKQATSIYSDMSKEKITLLSERDLPEKYSSSVKIVKESESWRGIGTYLLMENSNKILLSIRNLYLPPRLYNL